MATPAEAYEIVEGLARIAAASRPEPEELIMDPRRPAAPAARHDRLREA
ncbi:MAG: hypothetical protein J2P23_15440 [Microlunatus sp.]|nr:hypothetical protein [Microlunatus sp.]